MSRRGRSSSPISLFAFQDIITSVTAIIILITLILTLELLNRKKATSAESTTSAAEALEAAVNDANAEAERLEAELALGEEAAEELAMATPAQLRREAAELSEQADRLQTEVAHLKPQADAAAAAEERATARLYDRAADREKLASLQNQTKSKQEQLDQAKRQNRLIYNIPPNSSRTAWLVDLSGQQVKVSRFGKNGAETLFDGSSGVRQFIRWAGERSKSTDYFVLLVRPDATDTFGEVRKELDTLGFDIGFDLIAADQTVIHTSEETAP